METILKIESDASNITYGEMFNLCDKSVDDRQKLIIELRGLYPEIAYALKDKLIQFLNAENELIRAKRSFYRQEMKLSSALDGLREHIKNSPTSIYGWDYYKNRTARLKEEAKKEAKGMLDSAEAFSTAYRTIVEQEDGLVSNLLDSPVPPELGLTI